MITKVLVQTILQHAENFPWRMQSIGLMSLRLGSQREIMLHVWDPSKNFEGPLIHDHPFDFVSTIIVGEITNSLHNEDPTGTEYTRFRYSPHNENSRREDTVKLSKTSTTYSEGEHYQQLAHELHDSSQLPGTVTLIERSFRDVPELTVCLLESAKWQSGKAWPASSEEIKRISAKALKWF